MISFAEMLKDIIYKLSNLKPDDLSVIRVIPVVVQGQTDEQSIANAAMIIISQNPLPPGDNVVNATVQAGVYEVTIAVHIRKFNPPSTLPN